jgi:hypothetical protein
MKYLFVYFWSTVKFVMGPVTGKLMQLHWIETFLCTVLGMMTTVIVLTFAGEKVRKYWKSKKKTKIFTPKKRKIVKIWKKYGMWGVACLTPLLFTPIGGTLIAVSFGEKKHIIIFKMLIFGIFWGIILTLLTYFVGGFLIHT